MYNRADPDSLIDSDFSVPSALPDSSYREGSGAGRTLGRVLTDEVSVLRRRLELARDDIKRLSRARSTDSREPTEREKASEKRFRALEQKLAALQDVLKSKELALDQSTDACQLMEAELQSKNRDVYRFREQIELREAELHAKAETIAHLEQERDALRDELGKLTADRATENDAPAPPELPEPATPSLVRKYLEPAKRLSWAGALLAALAIFGLWSQQGGDSLAVGAAGVVPADSKISARPSPVVAAEPAPEVPAPASRWDGGNGAESVVFHAKSAEKVQDRLKLGSLGPALIPVKAGRFDMGSRFGLATDDALPVHGVSVDRFLIGAYEVTFDEYDLFARETGQRLPDDFGWGRGDRPVVDVSWWEAQAYVDWLSSQTGKGYRLPSEAEWEYAARGGSSTLYWWGQRVNTGQAVCFECGSRWDNLSTAPVASFPPNPFGLHDTAGNVMEWVADCYHSSYEAAPSDGSAWVTGGNCMLPVARGGAFNKPARSMRTAARHRFSRGTRINMLGFRVARDPDELHLAQGARR